MPVVDGEETDMMRVAVKPEMVRWARKRAGLRLRDLARGFPQVGVWERGVRTPTLRQLEAFARAVRVPLGYLFLAAPPNEALPLPDLRTVRNRPSPELLDTIYLCQRRQGWFRLYALQNSLPPVPLAGAFGLRDDPNRAASAMREALGLPVHLRHPRQLADKAAEVGVLVMAGSIVGATARRKLCPEEFRGFAIADDLAPLVFVNSAAPAVAQLFTLAHELAHICLGESGVSDTEADCLPRLKIEQWCASVASLLTQGAALCSRPLRPRRICRRFAYAVVSSTLEGQTLSREAFYLLGIRKSATFDRLARALGLSE
jgi:transcriptional regulator with XRE-family HTH domain